MACVQRPQLLHSRRVCSSARLDARLQWLQIRAKPLQRRLLLRAAQGNRQQGHAHRERAGNDGAPPRQPCRVMKQRSRTQRKIRWPVREHQRQRSGDVDGRVYDGCLRAIGGCGSCGLDAT